MGRSRRDRPGHRRARPRAPRGARRLDRRRAPVPCRSARRSAPGAHGPHSAGGHRLASLGAARTRRCLRPGRTGAARELRGHGRRPGAARRSRRADPGHASGPRRAGITGHPRGRATSRDRPGPARRWRPGHRGPGLWDRFHSERRPHRGCRQRLGHCRQAGRRRRCLNRPSRPDRARPWSWPMPVPIPSW